MNATLRKTLFLTCICLIVVVAISAIAMAQDDADDFTPIADHVEQMTAWEASGHGNTYAPGKGPNTYCSRCHSPQNWDPASRPGIPPNCITCHFAHEEEMRVADTMDFVAEEDWVGIGCDTCHMVDGDMINTTSNAWFNPIAEEYEPVSSTNALCGKCHTNSTGVSETGGRGVDHEIILGGSAHRNWAATIDGRRPDLCSDCHDPHTQQPMACVDCHEDAAEVHSDTHAEMVSCIACHDASGAEVGPNPGEEGGMWTTILTAMSRSGEPTVSPIVSHSVQWQVSCDRCHYEGNAWELPVLTEDGEPVDDGSGED